jgi:hypothetical protein
MFRISSSYGRFEAVRGRFGGLPGWARGIIAVLALPGLVLLVLSIAAVGVSILALLLLTVPAYRMLSAINSSGQTAAREAKMKPSGFEPSGFEPSDLPSPGRKHVEVKVVD